VRFVSTSTRTGFALGVVEHVLFVPLGEGDGDGVPALPP
jgi:hypothetical protein